VHGTGSFCFFCVAGEFCIHCSVVCDCNFPFLVLLFVIVSQPLSCMCLMSLSLCSDTCDWQVPILVLLFVAGEFPLLVLPYLMVVILCILFVCCRTVAPRRRAETRKVSCVRRYVSISFAVKESNEQLHSVMWNCPESMCATNSLSFFMFAFKSYNFQCIDTSLEEVQDGTNVAL
jgi:hypothetical protein